MRLGKHPYPVAPSVFTTRSSMRDEIGRALLGITSENLDIAVHRLSQRLINMEVLFSPWTPPSDLGGHACLLIEAYMFGGSGRRAQAEASFKTLADAWIDAPPAAAAAVVDAAVGSALIIPSVVHRKVLLLTDDEWFGIVSYALWVSTTAHAEPDVALHMQRLVLSLAPLRIVHQVLVLMLHYDSIKLKKSYDREFDYSCSFSIAPLAPAAPMALAVGKRTRQSSRSDPALAAAPAPSAALSAGSVSHAFSFSASILPPLNPDQYGLNLTSFAPFMTELKAVRETWVPTQRLAVLQDASTNKSRIFEKRLTTEEAKVRRLEKAVEVARANLHAVQQHERMTAEALAVVQSKAASAPLPQFAARIIAEEKVRSEDDCPVTFTSFAEAPFLWVSNKCFHVVASDPEAFPGAYKNTCGLPCGTSTFTRVAIHKAYPSAESAAGPVANPIPIPIPVPIPVPAPALGAVLSDDDEDDVIFVSSSGPAALPSA